MAVQCDEIEQLYSFCMTVELRINLVTSIILQLVMHECKHKYINVVTQVH